MKEGMACSRPSHQPEPRAEAHASVRILSRWLPETRMPQTLSNVSRIMAPGQERQSDNKQQLQKRTPG